MNLTIRRLQRVMSRLILRGSIVSLFVGLMSAPAPARATLTVSSNYRSV